MTSRERVLMAIEHKEPDRVPVCATYVPEIAGALREKYGSEGDLGVVLGNDMVKIASGIENSFYLSDEYTCRYGIRWRSVKNRYGSYTEIAKHPLAGDPSKIYDYKMPGMEENVLRQVRDAVRDYGREKWIIGSCQCSVFEAAWYLRGLEEFLMDLAAEEEHADVLLDKVMQFPLEMGLKFIDLGVDMVWLGDDISTQTSMMMSPDMWLKYLKPRYEKMFSAFKTAKPDIKLCYHSCGNVEAVVSELIDIGLDVLNQIQPLAMEPARFKKKFGKNITLYGGFDIQKILPLGTADDIRAETRRLMAACAPGGGFILSPAHHIQADTPLPNIEAFYAAAREYGQYPILHL